MSETQDPPFHFVSPPKMEPKSVQQFFSQLQGDPELADRDGLILLGIRELMTREAIDMVGDVIAFHEKFHQEYNGKPRTLPSTLQRFREETIQEEHDELKEAWAKGDRKLELDAIIDMIYFLIGTAYLKGYNLREGWRRVHRANMSKVPSQSTSLDGRGSKWDIVKPKDFVPPTMEGLC
jgi:predicted HAD superfamily Cof-like phosphohydrolase